MGGRKQQEAESKKFLFYFEQTAETAGEVVTIALITAQKLHFFNIIFF